MVPQQQQQQQEEQRFPLPDLSAAPQIKSRLPSVISTGNLTFPFSYFMWGKYIRLLEERGKEEEPLLRRSLAVLPLLLREGERDDWKTGKEIARGVARP